MRARFKGPTDALYTRARVPRDRKDPVSGGRISVERRRGGRAEQQGGIIAAGQKRTAEAAKLRALVVNRRETAPDVTPADRRCT